MFHDGEEFDVGVAHFEDVFDEFMREFAIGEWSVVFERVAPPGSGVYFVYGDWVCVWVSLLAGLQPFGIGPQGVVGLMHDRGCARAVFHTEGVGVAFGEDIAVLGFDFVFVEGAGLQVGDE